MHAILSKVLPHGNGMRVKWRTQIPLVLQKENYNIQMTKDIVSGHFSNLLAYFPSSPPFSFSSRTHITLTCCLVLYRCGTPPTLYGGIFLTFISYLFLYFTSQPQFTLPPLLPVLRQKVQRSVKPLERPLVQKETRDQYCDEKNFIEALVYNRKFQKSSQSHDFSLLSSQKVN